MANKYSKEKTPIINSNKYIGQFLNSVKYFSNKFIDLVKVIWRLNGIGRWMGLGSWLGGVAIPIFMAWVIIKYLNLHGWTTEAMKVVPFTTFGVVSGAFFTVSQVVISLMIRNKKSEDKFIKNKKGISYE